MFIFFSVGISHVCRFFEKYLSIVKLRSNLIEISIFFLFTFDTQKERKKLTEKSGFVTLNMCLYASISP